MNSNVLMMKIAMIEELLSSQDWDPDIEKTFKAKQDEYRMRLAGVLESENAVQHNETIRRCQS